MIRSFAVFWLRHIHPRLVSLIATVGIFGLASCLIILFVVAQIADEVLEKESFAFDRTLLLWIHSFANPNLDRVMLAITHFGNPSIVITVALVSFGILWWRHYQKEAKIFAIACLGASILNTGLKLFFTKPRPQLWTGLISETSFSFPSGHALGSFVLYGAIAYLLATCYPQLSILIYTLAVILIAAICISRLYLGVHWPTDIIAGYGIGFLWLTICTTMLKLQRMSVE
jgi:membrane-associated phospholipid phosphatase